MILLLFLLVAPRFASAAESYDNCTGFISSLPATIGTQGTWCLKHDLATTITSGNAITVNTNNVTIDCNDFKLGGLAAGAGTLTNGIVAAASFNTIVRHCNIRGFYVGIYLSGGGGGHLVEDNRFDGNTAYGLSVGGDGSVIRRNRVFDTGDSTANSDAFGIDATGSVDVVDNTITGVVARSGGNGSATGIHTDQNPGGRIVGNGVNGLVKDGTGLIKAINNTNSGRIAMHHNDVVGDGSTGSVGLGCASSNDSAHDNTISGFAAAISGCSDDGNNTIVP
jgi:hypothetical protein